MSRPSRPWLLPVACAVLGVVWVLWLAYETRTRGRSDLPTGRRHRNRRRQSPPGGPSPSILRAPVPKLVGPPSLLPVRAPRTRCGHRSLLRCNLSFRRPPARVSAKRSTFESRSMRASRSPASSSKSPTTLRCSRREAWRKSTTRTRTPGERAFAIERVERRTRGRSSWR